LTIHWAKPRDFTNHEQNILTALAITVSSVVASRRLYIQTLENVVRLRDLDTLKNEFMSSMSHELRTPLNAVIGLTDIILNGLDGELPPRAESDIRTVYNAGQQLLAIVNDVLDIAKIEAGHLTLMMTESNIQEPILEALDTATVMAENKQLTLLNSVPDNLPSVNIDKARLRQILLNLLSNAIKFTEQGTVEISAKVENELLIVCVRDEGIGIDPQHHGLVFEQFRQVEGALTRKKGGTGLGLPISKRLAEMHGGQMWLESELSKGCKFYFSLPLR
jgi:signal transduction histidine kinase